MSTTRTPGLAPTIDSDTIIKHIKLHGINGLSELKIKRALTNGGYQKSKPKTNYINVIKRDAKLTKYVLKRCYYNCFDSIVLIYKYHGNCGVYNIFITLKVLQNGNKNTINSIYYSSYRDLKCSCNCLAFNLEFYCKHCGVILYSLMDKHKIKDNSIPKYSIKSINNDNNITINNVKIKHENIPKYFDYNTYNIKALSKWMFSDKAKYGILIILMQLKIVMSIAPKCDKCYDKTIFDEKKLKWKCQNESCHFTVDVLYNSVFNILWNITIVNLVPFWKFMVYYLKNGLKTTLKDISELCGVNIKYCRKWGIKIRELMGIKRFEFGLIGCNSIIEFDAFYFSHKSRQYKYQKTRKVQYQNGLLV